MSASASASASGNGNGTTPGYLCADALCAAQTWLDVTGLPSAAESADEMIAAYYPGGLHWFIAQHLTSPDGTHIATQHQE